MPDWGGKGSTGLGRVDVTWEHQAVSGIVKWNHSGQPVKSAHIHHRMAINFRDSIHPVDDITSHLRPIRTRPARSINGGAHGLHVRVRRARTEFGLS